MAYFEDNTAAADFVKENLERITGFKTFQVDPNDDECMLPEQFEKIQAWFEKNEADIESADFEDFWDNFIDWSQCYRWVNGEKVYDVR